MKFVLEEMLYGIIMLLLIWVALAFVLSLEFLDNPWGFWLVAAACGVAVLYCARLIIRHPEAKWERGHGFIVATIAVLIIAILSDSEYFAGIGAGFLLFPIIFVGTPLGIGATRTLKSEFRPVIGRDIAVGIVSGIFGVLFVLLALQSGKVPFVGFANITTAHFSGLYFFPEQDTTRSLACNVGSHVDDWCKNASARNNQTLFAWFIQAPQSIVFVAWDTLVLALGAFVMNWLLRASLRRFGLLKH